MAGSDSVTRSIEEEMQRRIAAVYGMAQDYGATMEGEMKQNAPWQDRTGNARQGLHCKVEHNEAVKTIVLQTAHTADYGVYLEYTNSGKYAICGPTAKKYAPEVIDNARRIME